VVEFLTSRQVFGVLLRDASSGLQLTLVWTKFAKSSTAGFILKLGYNRRLFNSRSFDVTGKKLELKAFLPLILTDEVHYFIAMMLFPRAAFEYLGFASCVPSYLYVVHLQKRKILTPS